MLCIYAVIPWGKDVQAAMFGPTHNRNFPDVWLNINWSSCLTPNWKVGPKVQCCCIYPTDTNMFFTSSLIWVRPPPPQVAMLMFPHFLTTPFCLELSQKRHQCQGSSRPEHSPELRGFHRPPAAPTSGLEAVPAPTLIPVMARGHWLPAQGMLTQAGLAYVWCSNFRLDFQKIVFKYLYCAPHYDTTIYSSTTAFIFQQLYIRGENVQNNCVDYS